MPRSLVTVLAIVAVFGVLVPYYKRYDFLDPVLLAAYFCLPLVLVAPMAADALAGSAESAAKTVRSVLAIALYGWGLAIVVIAAGLMTVNASVWHGHVLLPRVTFLLAGALVSGAAAVASATATGLLAHRFSARAAKTTLRLTFLMVLVILVVMIRVASPEMTSAFWQNMTSAALTRFGFICGTIVAILDVAGVWMLARLRRVAE